MGKLGEELASCHEGGKKTFEKTCGASIAEWKVAYYIPLCTCHVPHSQKGEPTVRYLKKNMKLEG